MEGSNIYFAALECSVGFCHHWTHTFAAYVIVLCLHDTTATITLNHESVTASISNMLSRAVIVVQTNPAHIVRITISLFLT